MAAARRMLAPAQKQCRGPRVSRTLPVVQPILLTMYNRSSRAFLLFKPCPFLDLEILEASIVDPEVARWLLHELL